MKNSQRLDYTSLAEILSEQGLAEPQQIMVVLRDCQSTGQSFSQALVLGGLMTDWELSKAVCNLYGLPFLPVDLMAPAKDVTELVGADFIRETGIIPIQKFGQVLTVCMPALVPADVLAKMAAKTDLNILPVVGTVQGNGRWIEEHLPAVAEDHDPQEPGAALPQATELPDSDEWGGIFDAGDAAVRLDMTPEEAAAAELEAVDETLASLPDLDELDMDQLDTEELGSSSLEVTDSVATDTGDAPEDGSTELPDLSGF